MTPRLGCIADDFTGATDLANTLVRAGMRVVQTIGVPEDDAPVDADAIVVALKSRTSPAADAVAQSLAACRWLTARGARQIYFKVCSTFDSTPRGNIGPVVDALMRALDCRFAIATPAFPENGRTVFKGHLFVGDVLLSDSGMRDHPSTPMTDANLVRVLQAQTTRRVGLVDHRVVRAGVDAIRARFDALARDGVEVAIVDALDDDDLVALGTAARDLALVCAGSGLALGLPSNWGLRPSSDVARLPPSRGFRAIVSGSCSTATRAQVEVFVAHGGAARIVDPFAAAHARDATVASIVAWARDAWRARPDAPVLVYSTADPSVVRRVQSELGVDGAGALVESTLAAVARGLVDEGARRIVVAGGETSGACVAALGVALLAIGVQIDPGVPWCHATGPSVADGGYHLALKSGNFGAVDFFTKAFACLP